MLVYHIMLERFKSKSQNTSLPTKCQRCPSKKQLATRCKPTRPYSISGWMKTWGCVCEIIAVIVAAFTQRSRKRAPSRRVTSEICEYAVRWPMILRVHKILLKFQNKAETADVSMRSMFEKRCHLSIALTSCSSFHFTYFSYLQLTTTAVVEEALSSSFQVFGDHFWLLQVF